jgi:hypothetical protein
MLLRTHYEGTPFGVGCEWNLIAHERSTLVTGEKYIGLDVHQATISVAVMDGSGKLVMESILETKASTLLQFWPGSKDRLLARSGFHGKPVYWLAPEN